MFKNSPAAILTVLVIVLIIGIILTAWVFRDLIKYWFNREPINLDDYANDPLRGVYNPSTGDWRCCDHCYDEHGFLTHELESIDFHTIPCNEKGCQQDTYCYDRNES